MSMRKLALFWIGALTGGNLYFTFLMSRGPYPPGWMSYLVVNSFMVAMLSVWSMGEA